MNNIALNFSNQANIYIFLWCVYYLQGTLYASGGVLSQSVLSVVLIISVCNYCRVITQNNNPFYLKCLNVLVLMFIFYGTMLLLSGDMLIIKANYIVAPNYTYLKQILISLLPIYSAYLYTKQGLISSSILRFWIPIWLLITMCTFYYNQQTVLALLADSEEITNNEAYNFLALIPILILYNRKPVIMFLGLFICMFFILIGMKRGAILISIITIFVLVYYMYKLGNAKIRFYIFLFSLIIGIVFSYVVIEMLSNSEYFMSRIEATLEGNSSGRNIIYSFFWNYFIEQPNVLSFLFGNGANATLKIGINYAHNDWLELCINQGLFGVLIYMVYFIAFYRITYFRFQSNPYYSVGLKLVFIITFLSTIFSMSYASMYIFLSISLGYFLAKGEYVKT